MYILVWCNDGRTAVSITSKFFDKINTHVAIGQDNQSLLSSLREAELTFPEVSKKESAW